MVSIRTLLRILLTGKKHRQIKLRRLQKVRIWTFGSLIHQINSLKEVLKLKQNSRKNLRSLRFVNFVLSVLFVLRILIGKKYSQIKLQRERKI